MQQSKIKINRTNKVGFLTGTAEQFDFENRLLKNEINYFADERREWTGISYTYYYFSDIEYPQVIMIAEQLVHKEYRLPKRSVLVFQKILLIVLVFLAIAIIKRSNQ